MVKKKVGETVTVKFLDLYIDHSLKWQIHLDYVWLRY